MQINNEEIISLYKTSYSVSEVLRYLKTKGISIGRLKVTNILKNAGLYEGLSGKNYTKKKAEQHKKIMLEKYGVDNISKIKNAWSSLNKIYYDKISFDDDLKRYNESVRKLTSKNKKYFDNEEYCFYTGVKFADFIKSEVNPNDPFKKTIDHKKPIILCFFEGLSVEEAASLDNLVCVCRYANSLKSNTTNESFLEIAKILKRKFIDEGYECK